MASRRPYDGDTQPGLEVVPGEHGHHQDAPEVRDTSNDNAKELYVVSKYPGTPGYYSQAPEQYDGGGQLLATPPAAPGGPAPRRRRRLWIVIGVLVGLMVVLAAILGGILGSRAAAGSSSVSSQQPGQAGVGAGTATGTAAAKATPSGTQQRLQQIQQGSALAVTGLRKTDGGLDMFLFYQDPQENIRFSRCDTTQVTSGNSKTCWDVPISISTFARPGAHLSVGTILYGESLNGQTQLVYSGERNRFLSSNLNDRITPRVTDDSVNAKQYTMGSNSSLGSYWPWTLYQDSTGRLHHVRNQLRSGYSPAAEWDEAMLDIVAMNGSSLAIVPMSTNMSRIAEKGGYSLFYQDLQGRLAVSVIDLNSPQLDPTYPLSWPTTIPSIDLPTRAPIAALSVARPNDAARQRVDTHVWYLDASSNINVLYTDTSSGSPVWRTSQPAALRGADPDTSLACLNMATSQVGADGSPKLLELASADTKCYFQRGGLVMEARLDRGDWIVTGNVPIP